MLGNNKNSKIPDRDLQDSFKTYIKQKRFLELAKLIEKSESVPPEYIVRMGYKGYIEENQGRKVKLFYIMKLKEITGILPDKNVIKEACEISLGMETPEVLEALIKRVGIEKDTFHDLQATIQRTYTDYVAEGKFVDISKLMELTGTRPEDDIIHHGYEMYLEEGKFISFAGLKKRTGIKPNPDLIQSMYRQYYFYYLKSQRTSKEQAAEWVDRIRKLKRISKVELPEGITIPEEDMRPEGSEETVTEQVTETCTPN
ncbi:MAG: hypothetical protein ACM3SY_11055 [Candidatus Omnitrophota bacterium]